MAVGAIVGARHARLRQDAPSYMYVSAADLRRIKAEMEADAERRRYKKLLERYDSDTTGKLNKEQMVKLLTDLDSSTPPGTAPSEEELNFIIQCADVSGSWLGFSDGEIDAEEIEEAVVKWSTYTRIRNDLDKTFKKFDKTETGQLNPDELKEFLKELNGGKEVTDEEVKWVLKMSDLSGTGEINKPELMLAAATWYTYVKDGKKKPGCCAVL
mmetsp:Transcript_96758/g.312450  ORF Transcript_96758/g.312450 Transcript_96758/m.312450 type:complete len:213 (+) Transcript_96758:56-694(+)